MAWEIPDVARTEFAAAVLQTTITTALACLCLFLYRRHGKPYFAWFAAAWALYVVRLLAIGTFLGTGIRAFLYAHQVITGLVALALLWAALVFSRQLRWRWAYLVVVLFPPAWSLLAIYELDSFLLAAAPMVAFLSLATVWTGVTFWRYHRKVGSPGALLLGVAFVLWGLHHLDYPFLRARGAWSPWGYYLDIAFELAVGGGIMLLVMDDLRRGLAALSALSGDLQRSARGGGEGEVLDALLARPLSLPAMRGTAFFRADGGGLVCERGAGRCAAWAGTRPEGALAELLARAVTEGRPHTAQNVAGHASLAALPVLAEGAAPAALVLAGEARDPFTALDESFLRALGQQVGAALHSAALYRALQERRAELERLSLRMVRQHEDERRRLSRELHDETAQVTHDLRPSLLDDLGLLPALRSLCADFEERTGIVVTLDLPPSLPAVPEDTDLALFRALQEGLSNVARHAGARGVRVKLRADGDGALCLAVRDDGAGLGGGVDLARWEREGHMGLVGMRERIAALGGSVTLAGADDGGAELRVRVPVAAPAGAPAA
jgi:signal transduction histidine kinase